MKIDFITPPAKGKIPKRVYGCSYQIYPQPDIISLYCATISQRRGHTVTIKGFTLENNTHYFQSFTPQPGYGG